MGVQTFRRVRSRFSPGILVLAVIVASILCTAMGQESVDVWKFGSPQGERDYFSEVNEQFTEYPLDVQFFDWDSRFQRVATANSGNNLPDILIIENSMLPNLAEEAVLLDLQEIAPDAAEQWSRAYPEPLWELGVFRDSLYGFSPYVDLSPVLLYNTRLLEEAGVSPPRSWSELVDTAEKLTTNSVYGIAFGASTASLDADIIESIAAGNGVRWIDENTGEVVIGDQGLVDTFQLIQELLPYAPQGLTDLNFRGALQLFFQERAAMVITKSFAPIIQADYGVSSDFPSVMIPFPSPDEATGRYAPASFEAQAAFLFAATRQVDNQDGVIAYLDFWADPSQHQGWDGSVVQGRIPTAKALLESDGFAQQYPGLAAAYREGELFETVISIPAFPEYTELRSTLTEVIQRLVLGATTPEQAAATLESQANRAIE
ncbi:MAG: extracellular solute-binding protein [Trueperaceae bacterium]